MQLIVNPQGPQTLNPNLQIQIHLSVMASIPADKTRYRFEAKIPMNGDHYDFAGSSTWLWTPQEAGDYVITATVIELVPGNPTRIPCGSASTPYHVAPQKISNVTLSATPASMSVPGNIALHASVPGGFPGVNRYKFAFSYGKYWRQSDPPMATTTITTANPKADWTLTPQPAPDLYRMQVDVETFVFNHLVAEGQAMLDPANGYAVLFARSPCPPANRTSTPSTPFGWLNPITAQNTTQPVSSRIPNADCAIAGYSINDIVNNPQVRVRKINVACNNCHMDFAWQQKSAFCNYAAGFGHASTDPVLQSLLLDWNHRGCPD